MISLQIKIIKLQFLLVTRARLSRIDDRSQD